MNRTLSVLLLALAPNCSKSEPNATMQPVAAPSSTEIANRLAHDPEFVNAVADQVMRRVAAHVAVAAVPPVAPTAPVAAPPAPPMTVVIDASGAMIVDGRRLSDADLASEVRVRLALTPDLRAVIAADRSTSHARVVQVIDALRTAGVTRFALQTAPP